ncbi:sphingomyelinase [Cavenderia fasciculata]|uniref:Sphingomyelin phosphodiesterase n=1 Tax=Cavenderia fasciculata TaxID=261658 RepID=F4PLK4_CACFS|nr:sphingomyelinase [Cavenderia fasciculata]EGG23426.1 sphingomyelinase [Cavenderia fasciculata]|eukprot:XP_004361277.1 sphingomyelinase [Cavenderia fasciculata]
MKNWSQTILLLAILFIATTYAHYDSHAEKIAQNPDYPHYLERLKAIPISCALCTVGADILSDLLQVRSLVNDDSNREFKNTLKYNEKREREREREREMINSTQKNASTTIVVNTTIDLCIAFKIELPDVCHGVMNTFVPIIWDVIVTDNINPMTLCELFRICQPNSTATEQHNQFHNNNNNNMNTFSNLDLVKTLEEKPVHTYPDISAQKPIREGNTTFKGKGYFLQLADIHFDAYYLEGSNPNCGKPLCCRDGTGDAGFYGHYQCDIPLVTVKTMFERIVELTQTLPIDLILWTGDSPPHDVWMQTEEKQTTATQTLTELVHLFFPDTIVFPAIGNHESYPADQFILPDKQWLLNDLSTFWAPFLGGEQLDTVQQQGYYTLLIQQGLRIISLNTQDADLINFYNLMNESNMNKPNNQTEWLSNMLAQSASNSEKVIIIGHIPCTLKAAVNDVWCSIYQRLVEQYSGTIVGQIYGHTHDDQLAILTDMETYTKPTGVQFIAPSLTTYQNHEPGFRIYEFDYDTNQITDYYQYHCNITEANLTGNLTFSLTYQAKEMYGLSDMSPQSWFQVATQMKTDSTVFNKYYSHLSSSPNPLKPCDADCQYSMACEIFSVTSHAFDNCVNIQKNKK